MKRALGKLLSAVCIALNYGAVFVLTGAWWMEGMHPATWAVWPLLAVVLSVLAGIPSGRGRAVCGVAGIAVCAAAVMLWLPFSPAWLVLVPGLALYWYILRRAQLPPFVEWSIQSTVIGMGLYPVAMICVRILEMSWVLPILRTLLMVNIPLFLLHVNRVAIRSGASTRDGSRPPRRIVSGNRKLTLAVATVALILLNLDTLRTVFYRVAVWLRDAVVWVFNWISSLFATAPTEPGMQQGAPSSMELPMEQGEASMFWRVMEILFGVLAFALVAVIAIVLIVKLARHMRVWIRRLAARMREAMRQLGEGIQEQTESILDWEEVRDAARARIRHLRDRMRPAPRWDALDNRGRVRFVYRRWLKGHPTVPPSATAQEALRDVGEGGAIASIYDRARYSDAAIAPDEVERMRRAAGREG